MDLLILSGRVFCRMVVSVSRDLFKWGFLIVGSRSVFRGIGYTNGGNDTTRCFAVVRLKHLLCHRPNGKGYCI